MLSSIDLTLAERLKDPEFRREWFLAELETEVPQIFRDLRELRDLTQAELAEKANKLQSSIARFEMSAKASWKIEYLLVLANALDAQLSITLEPAENVIAGYEKEESEVPRTRSPKASVMDAKSNYELNVIGSSALKGAKDEGVRPWN